jgi:hypothetical protein
MVIRSMFSSDLERIRQMINECLTTSGLAHARAVREHEKYVVYVTCGNRSMFPANLERIRPKMTECTHASAVIRIADDAYHDP